MRSYDLQKNVRLEPTRRTSELKLHMSSVIRAKAVLYLTALLLTFGVTISLFTHAAVAQFTIASDNASTNYSGGLGNGSTGGFGFGAWSITYGSNTGTFTGSPGSDGMSTTTIGTNAWAFYSTGSGGNYVNATRPFSQAMAVGDTFTFDWAMNWDANSGNKGFDLLASGSTIFNVNNGGSSTITAGGSNANTVYGTNAMTVTVSRTSGSEYSFTMTSRSGGSDYTTTISSSSAIDALKIYSGDQNDGSGNRNIYFNNLKITRSSAAVSLTGSAGWRLLSSPAQSNTFSSMLGPIWTQGASTGADVTNGSPNVFTWSTASGNTDASNWNAVTDLNTAIPAGSGFLVYVFADDNYDGVADAFPKALSVSGTEHGDGITATINNNASGWTLVGSPYASTIGFGSITKTDLTNSVYVWDPIANGWKSWNGSEGDITDGLIKPFQAFFVQTASTINETPGLTFNNDDKTTGGSFYGKSNQEPRQAIRLQLDGESLSNSTWFSFSESGSFTQQVMGDALELEPLSSRFARLAARKGDVLYDIAHLPSGVAEYRVPLDVAATESGEFTLSATIVELPEDLEVWFRDNRTGIEERVDTDLSYTFTLDAAAKVRGLESPGDIVARPLMAKATGVDRFELIVRSYSAVSNTGETVLPTRVELAQNYPNPFNPSTQIRFSLPQAGEVSLRVFDLLGREMAAPLRSRAFAAGWHSVEFDATDLPSGTYIYRLETINGEVLTRQMTLLK